MRKCNQTRKALRAVLNRQMKRRIRARKQQRKQKYGESAQSETRRVNSILNKIKPQKVV